MPVFYPSMEVELKIRFDDDVMPAASSDAEPVSPDGMSRGSDVLGRPGNGPALLRTTPPYSFLAGRVPSQANIDLPGYRKAATFSLEFPFKDLPFDPLSVKAAAVEIYVGVVAADDFAKITRSGRAVLRTHDRLGLAVADNLAMVGTVDEWKVSHSGTGSTAHLSGRDMRAFLIDTPVALLPGETEFFFGQIDTTRDIANVVQAILKQHPLMAGTRVRVNAEEWPDGKIPSPASSAAVPRHRKGATGKGRKAASAGPGEVLRKSYWDLIVHECYLVGAIPHWVGMEIHIRPARAIFDQLRAGIDPANHPTPFAGGRLRRRDAATGKPIEPMAVRRLVYGRDVQDLSINRKFGGYQKPKIVRVISTDDSTPKKGEDRLLQARWPRESDADKKRAPGTKPSPGEELAQKEILNIPVSGIRDKAQLEAIAKAVFEEIGRGELGGSCSTPNLASFGGDNSDPDLLRLRPGDGVELSVDVRALARGSASPLVSTFTDFQRRPLDEVVQELAQALGGDRALARAVVMGARSQRAQRFFRVSSVKFDWSAESGMKVNFEFQNYVVATNEVGPEMSRRDGTATAVAVPARAPGKEPP